MKNKKIMILLIIAFVIGLSVGYLFFKLSNTELKSPTIGEKKLLYWVAPMDANYKRDEPGKSPMGMDLVPVYQTDDNEDGIKIAANVLNNISVKIEPVQYRTLIRSIDTLGVIQENENNIEHIHVYENGWIRKLYVNEVGGSVTKGELIAQIYSPKLIEAEQELVLALTNQSSAKPLSGRLSNYSDQTDYVKAAKTKLQSLGISQKQIQRIIKNKKADTLIDIYSSISGVISAMEVKEGMYVTPENNLMTIVNLDTVWLSAEIFPNQINDVQIGDEIIGRVNGVKNEVFYGKIDFISPTIDPVTRTISVRATLNNTKGVLMPNVFMDVTVQSKNLKNVLSVPIPAVIRIKNIDYVIISLKDNRFIAQEIKLGQLGSDYYQVLAGLKENDKVVVSAQFLIDSESNVQASLRRLNSSKNNNQDAMNMQDGSH